MKYYMKIDILWKYLYTYLNSLLKNVKELPQLKLPLENLKTRMVLVFKQRLTAKVAQQSSMDGIPLLCIYQ